MQIPENILSSSENDDQKKKKKNEQNKKQTFPFIWDLGLYSKYQLTQIPLSPRFG